MRWLWRKIRQLWCPHHDAHYRRIPLYGGEYVIQVKCDLCGATRCGQTLEEI